LSHVGPSSSEACLQASPRKAPADIILSSSMIRVSDTAGTPSPQEFNRLLSCPKFVLLSLCEAKPCRLSRSSIFGPRWIELSAYLSIPVERSCEMLSVIRCVTVNMRSRFRRKAKIILCSGWEVSPVAVCTTGVQTPDSSLAYRLSGHCRLWFA
jgi:hypothetical protein